MVKQSFSLLIAVLFFLFSPFAIASLANESSDPKESAKARTADDPYVPVEELRLILTAFTKGELLIEAEAWQKILRQKVAEIGMAEIAVKRQNVEIEKAKEIGNQAEKGQLDLLEKVNRLREERTIIVDNFKAVVDALTDKTGEGDGDTLAKVKDYQLYAKSVLGIRLDTTDVTSSWMAVKGWLLSEEGGIRFGKNILQFFAILLIAWLVSGFLRRVARHALSRANNVSRLLEDFLSKAVRWIVMAVGGIMALAALEVSVAPLIALMGAAGFVIALALKDSLSNFASGIMILFFRPFDVGDFIDAGGVSGEVTSMNLVSTTFMTVDNKRMVVPNNMVWQDVITNATGVRNRRIDLIFGIGYESDIDKAKEVLWGVISDHEKVLEHPEPNVRVHELADSSVNLICRPWVRSGDYWDTYWDFTETVKKRFDEEGISIPFPQSDVHLHVESGDEQVKF